MLTLRLMLGSRGAGTSPCRRLHGESMAEAVGGGKMPPWLSHAAGAMPAALLLADHRAWKAKHGGSDD